MQQKTLDAENDVKRAMLVFVIENVLLKISKPSYELVLSKLENNYNCSLADCRKNPEHLKRVLQDVYGNSFDRILDQIKEELGEIVEQKYYQEFLTVMADK